MAGKLVTIDSTYIHVQEDPEVTWVINHGLNTTAPMVNVWIDDNGIERKVIPNDIKVINAGTVNIIFSVPRIGKAVIL